MKFYSSFTITPEISYANRALAYGDGLFETMYCQDYEIPLLTLHWCRLTDGLKKLQLGNVDIEVFKEKLQALINDKGAYIVKLIVFRKGVSRGYSSEIKQNDFVISVSPYKERLPVTELITCSVKLSRQKQTAGLKHLSRLEQVLASQSLICTNYQDALMLDIKDKVIETINKNVVFIKNNQLYSPRLNQSGVYGVALRWMQSEGFKINWKNIDRKKINKFDAMLICNSIIGFQLIRKVDDVEFDNANQVFDQISSRWQETIRS